MFFLKFLLQLFLFICFLFGLFALLQYKSPSNFENYFYNLENISPKKRYGNLLDYNWLTDDRIKFGNKRDFNPKSLIFESNEKKIKQQIQSGQYVGYLGEYSKIKKWTKNGVFKIIGKDVHQKGYAFIMLANKNINFRDKNATLFYRFSILLRHFSRLDFGKTSNGFDYIGKLFYHALPNTLILISLTTISIVILGIIFSIIITYGFAWIRTVGEQVLEFFSAVPEFLLSFALLFFFAYSDNQFYNGHITFFYTYLERLSFSNIIPFLRYFSLPVLALSLAGGTVSALTKYLSESLIQSQKTDAAIFFKANGMKQSFLHYVFPLKKFISIIVLFIGTKIPLIIGSSVVIEKIFSIYGIGNLAFEYFERQDIGMILIVFSFLYLSSILLNNSANLICNTLTPSNRMG